MRARRRRAPPPGRPVSGGADVVVPDLGDFDQVEVIEVLVAPGDTIAVDTSLVTLESDKATLEVPSPRAGVVEALKVRVGDRVSAGSPLLTLRATGAGAEPATTVPAAPAARPAAAPAAAGKAGPQGELTTEVVVLGAGPGGYTAAFRAADLGRRVVLVERHPTLGGVCLNVGCIPSKALLHAARVIGEARDMAAHGIRFGEPQIDLDRLRDWKSGVVGQLTKGLGQLARQRKVDVVQGVARFSGPRTLAVETDGGTRTIAFEQAIVAAGSEAVRLPGWPDDPRIVTSTGALALADVPARLLVVGGGIIGLEMATVYAALGSRVTVVELLDTLMPGADRDLVKPLETRLKRACEAIRTGTKVTGVRATAAGIEVGFDGPGAPPTDTFDRVLVAVGRRPNGAALGLAEAGVTVTPQGFVPVDAQMRTNVAHIFAIGDIVGQPMLAHKATHEGKVAAEVAAGHKSAFEAQVIPSVAYTDPEVAWVGMTETAARAAGTDIGKAVFPWAASGRALGVGRPEGLTKLVFERTSGRIIGGGIVGVGAGDLIAEIALAIEMGADAADIGLTVHPHPTLSETVAMAAEAYEGTITDLYLPKR